MVVNYKAIFLIVHRHYNEILLDSTKSQITTFYRQRSNVSKHVFENISLTPIARLMTFKNAATKYNMQFALYLANSKKKHALLA